MTNKIYVITGTKNEYEEYIRKDTRKRWNNGDTSASYSDYVYVAGTYTLRGLRDIHGVFVGNYHMRGDFYDITTMLDLVNDKPYGYHMKLIEGKG
jgi:hypothetical protein